MNAPFSTWGGRGKQSASDSAPDILPFPALFGWQGLILQNPDVDIVDLAREFAVRFREEACGQCFPCRMGSEKIAALLEGICEGRGKESDLAQIESLARYVMESARCDIGQTSPRPILDALNHFKDHFAAAIREGKPRPKQTYVNQVTAPCISACPARVNVPGYVESLRVDRWDTALERVFENCCLPGVIGRVCVRLCEHNCRRGVLDSPIAIKALKRHAADREIQELGVTATYTPIPSPKGKVAIVGAGPAGLSCAYYLGRKGYATTLFEALPEPGGMAAVGIPDYRLPRKILRDEAAKVEAMGAEIRYGVKVGQDIKVTDMFEQGYGAVFVGAGAPGATAMRCEGEDAGYEGFMPGVEFLRRVADGENPLPGKRILVIGGGNVAMDCVRSSLRLGFTDVNLVYRRTEKEMPADRVEIEESHEEGVKFHTLVAPVKIHAKDGKVTGLECIRMELGEPDKSGRRRPVPMDGSNFIMECDAIIPAIGQKCEVDTIVPEGVKVEPWQTLVVDKATGQSTDPRIFGGGDCVTGPSTLVAALGAGRLAADSIARFLETGECKPTPATQLDSVIQTLSKGVKEEAPPFAAQIPRENPAVVEPEIRITNFSEVESWLTPVQARNEAGRCLRCYRIAVAVLP